MNSHLTNDQLLDKLYGIADAAAEPHLGDCPDCSARWQRLSMQRSSIHPATLDAVPAATEEFFAAQRRAIYARMDARQPAWWQSFFPQSVFSQKGLAASAAAVLVIVGGLAFFRAGQTPVAGPSVAKVQPEISDSQFFAEMASIEQGLPQSVSPIQALFVQDAAVGKVPSDRTTTVKD